MQVTINKVSWDAKDKQGNPLISKKSGKPYYKVGLQVKEHGEVWINGLMPFAPTDWEGKTKDLEIFDEEYQGKTYKKFKLAPRAPAASDEKVLNAITALTLEVRAALSKIPKPTRVVEEEVYPDDEQ